MQILSKNVYSLIGDQCYNDKIYFFKKSNLIFSKCQYYFEYCNVAKFIGY